MTEYVTRGHTALMTLFDDICSFLQAACDKLTSVEASDMDADDLDIIDDELSRLTTQLCTLFEDRRATQ